MVLIIGLKFKKFYNQDNVNNIGSCEVRGIIDGTINVLWCNNGPTRMGRGKEFYLSIPMNDFEYNVKENIYQELV